MPPPPPPPKPAKTDYPPPAPPPPPPGNKLPKQVRDSQAADGAFPGIALTGAVPAPAPAAEPFVLRIPPLSAIKFPALAIPATATPAPPAPAPKRTAAPTPAPSAKVQTRFCDLPECWSHTQAVIWHHTYGTGSRCQIDCLRMPLKQLLLLCRPHQLPRLEVLCSS